MRESELFFMNYESDAMRNNFVCGTPKLLVRHTPHTRVRALTTPYMNNSLHALSLRPML